MGYLFKERIPWLMAVGFVFNLGQAATITFEADVRPILKTHCFHCHGEDGSAKGGLDVRLRKLLLKGGKHGPAIALGQAEKSLFYTKIRDGEMPKEQAKLPAAQIETIRLWIEQGAETARPQPDSPDEWITEEERRFWAFQPINNPPVPSGTANPIDAFLLRRLNADGLGFSPKAGKRTLIRRATFDLTGLPPTPEEIAKFLADETPQAYDQLIDRLLASPNYGERWGRHWLDVAGYADSEGYTERDAERGWAWRYRDYVVRALNDDMPWDRFVKEQLAGDEMVSPPYADLAPEQVDKLTATGFLRMAPDGTGSGANNAEAQNQVMAETLKIVSTSLMGMTVGCAQCHDHRYDPILQSDYYKLRAVFEPALDPANWRTPQSRQISLFTEADRKQCADIEVDAKKLDAKRQTKVDFFIERTLEWKLRKEPEELREPLRAAYKTPAAKRTAEQKALLDDHPSVRQISPGSLYLYDREFNDEIAKLNAERKKLADKKDAEALKKIDEQIKYFRGSLTKKVLDAMAKKAADARAAKPEEPFIRALTEQAGKVPVTHLFFRGDHGQPKAAVKPADLSVVALNKNPIPENDGRRPSTGRRLALAKRLTDGTHPLTGRVLVNRFWLHHFGRGLVDTPGDFGKLGEMPSHPELLDWLATDFMKNGWRLKRLHHLIMTSQAYRQASRRLAKLDELDPDNRLLGRMSVRRLEAETLRDSILFVSGQWNPRMFGKPIPVKEDEVGQIVVGVSTNDNSNRPTGKTVSLGAAKNRRSLYVQLRRSKVLSFVDTFDAPTMEPNCTKRTVSTVAPQALMLMNNSFVINESRSMAGQLQRLAKGRLDTQLGLARETALGQAPGPGELAQSAAFIEKQAALFAAQKEKQPDLAALANYCQALLSSNAFIYVD
jgi:hypothetical protein